MEVDEYQQKTISLVIKTPSQAQEELTVDGVSLDWTVKELKTHLSTLYSDTLAVSDQRLIYGGKLLPDHLHMKDLFRQTDSVPTLHLVCAARNPALGPMGARPKTTETSSHVSSSAQTPGTLRQRRETSSTSSSHVQTSPSWPPAAAAAAVPGAATLARPAFPTYSLYSPQQLLWLQHVYARQYYMQYHAALTTAGTHLSAPATAIGQRPPGPTHHIPVPDPLANQNPINNLPANQNPVQDAAFMDQGREANQNMRMNAQGGPVMEDDEDVERDWLDWLYSAARFAVLLVIIYFNSNLSRFLLVMSTLLLMYLHTVGRFPFRRPAPVQEPPPEARNNDRNPNPQDNLADPQREEPDPAAADASHGPMTAVLVPPHRVSVMWTLWVFFKTFFSSLIPEAPQGLAN